MNDDSDKRSSETSDTARRKRPRTVEASQADGGLAETTELAEDKEKRSDEDEKVKGAVDDLQHEHESPAHTQSDLILQNVETEYTRPAVTLKTACGEEQQNAKRFCVIGRANVQCIQGSCEILGYRMKSSDNSSISVVEVESPAWTSVLTLSLSSNTIVQVDSLRPPHMSQRLSQLPQKPQPQENGVALQTQQPSTFRLIEHNTSSPMLISGGALTTVSAATLSWAEAENENNNKDQNHRGSKTTFMVRPTVIPHSWQDAADSIIQDISRERQLLQEQQQPAYLRSSLEPPPERAMVRIAICGSKGAGKSTCLRYTANRILSSFEYDSGNSGSNENVENSVEAEAAAVVILDADVGQPEMSPPGMVTLTVVSKPLLSPPHRHMVMPHCDPSTTVTSSNDKDIDNSASLSTTNIKVRDNTSGHFRSSRHCQAYYFGSVSSKQDPTRYIECIQQLLEYHEQELRHLPLLVNLDGWVKGMGFQILTNLLKIKIRPTHVIQILGDSKSQFFDLCNNDILSSSATKLYVVNAHDSIREPQFCQEQQTQPENNQTTTAPPISGELSTLAQSAVRSSSPAPLSEDTLEESKSADSAPEMTATEMSTPMPASSNTSNSIQKPQPKALRSLRLCTYFLNDMSIWDRLGFGQRGIIDHNSEIGHRLAMTKPYVVPFEAVRCLLVHTDQRENDVQSEEMMLNALNASIVGLCCDSTNRNGKDEGNTHLSDMANNNDTQQDATTILPCVGLGLIRSIDRIRRLFFILTPVESAVLQESVNVLVRGDIEIPIECLFRGVHAEAFPYITFRQQQQENQESFSTIDGTNGSSGTSETMASGPVVPVGAEPIKSRNNIGRERLQRK